MPLEVAPAVPCGGLEPAPEEGGSFPLDWLLCIFVGGSSLSRLPTEPNFPL